MLFALLGGRVARALRAYRDHHVSRDILFSKNLMVSIRRTNTAYSTIDFSFRFCTFATVDAKAAITSPATGIAKHKGNTILPLVM